MSDPLYRRELLRLAADAHGAGRLSVPHRSGLAFNPACGDRISVQLTLADGRVAEFAHETKACVLAQASASILGSALGNATVQDVKHLHSIVSAMLQSNSPAPAAPFGAYAAFEGAVEYRSRHRCVLLPIDAVIDAFERGKCEVTMTIEDARSWFAEDLRVSAGIKSAEVIAAFARVPREKFIGPPPWRVGMRAPDLTTGRFAYQTFDGDPSVLYHDVVVALDSDREINNGEPGLWARMFDALDLRSGERVLHLGCGTGYYTAVMAEIVGMDGTVMAVEIDETLAGRAREALSDRIGVSVTTGDGLNVEPDAYDAIVVSAGATHPLEAWLNGLGPGSRLLFPITMETSPSNRGMGAMLLITQVVNGAFAARFLGPAAFIHFRGGRDAAANEKLLDAFRRRFKQMSEVRSLRRDAHEPDDSCWLHGESFCLSSRALEFGA